MRRNVPFAATVAVLSLLNATRDARADCIDDGAGTITCTGTTDANGIAFIRGPVTFRNLGLIEVPSGISGMIAGGSQVMFENAAGATISSLGDTAVTTVTDHNLVIRNLGVISQQGTGAAAAVRIGRTISTVSVDAVLENAGRIESSTIGILTGQRAYNFTLNNTGQVIGADAAIQINGLNTTLNFGDGSQVAGLIQRVVAAPGQPGYGNESGQDVVTLAGSGRFTGGFSGPFDRLTMNGVDWRLRQTAGSPASFDIVDIQAGILRLSDGTLQVGSLASVASGASLVIEPTGVLQGPVLVSGTLVADGTSPGANVEVLGPAGLVTGTGALGLLSVLPGATVAPGNPSGTLTATTYTQADGATLRLQVDGARMTSLAVTGSATLGGIVQVVPAAVGAVPAAGQTYTVVQGGAVNGRFAAVRETFAFFDFVASYTASQANLTAVQLPFSTGGVTNGVRNLVNQAGAFDAYVAASAPGNADFALVTQQLLGLSTPQAITALHSVSGESYAGFTTVALEQLDMFRNATLDAAGACEGRGGLVQGRFCTWADAYRVNGSLDGQGDLAGFDYSITGLQSGIEMRVLPDSVVGLSVGYGGQRMSGFDFASRRLDGDALFGGLYGTHGFGPWQAVGLVGYSRFDVDAERDIAVGNIARQATSSYGASGLNAAAALRYRAELAGLRVVPEMLLAYSQYWQDPFTETGAGSLNLRVQGTDSNSFVTGIGVTASTDWVVGGVVLRPLAGLRYEHDWLAGSKDDHQVTASFAQVPQAGSWTVFGQNRGPDSLSGRLGIAANVADSVAVYGGLAGQLNTNGTEWGFGGGVRVTF